MPTDDKPSSEEPTVGPGVTAALKRRRADESLVNARLRELFPGAKPTAAEASKHGSNSPREVGSTFQMLAHSRIQVRPQVRRTFPQAELDELASSIHEIRAQGGGIEATGVLQALLVSPQGDGYRLIAGEKRFRATREEGVPQIPCIVIPMASEGMVRLLQLAENSQRTQPPILEEATAIQEAMQEQELSIRNMARVLGKEKGYVESRLNLLKYPKDVQEMVSARADTLRHARHIGSVEDESLRTSLIHAAIEDGISEREVQRRIASAASDSSPTGSLPEELSARADSSDADTSNPAGEGAQRAQGSGRTIGGQPRKIASPASQALRPAATIVAAFTQQISIAALTDEIRRAVEDELALLEQEVASLRRRLAG